MLDAETILAGVSGITRSRVMLLEAFAEISSTNSYLMDNESPSPGDLRIAATTNQTAGRGRHGRRWLTPPGSGLCLSIAYTFASASDNLPALTLAIGVGSIKSLQDAHVYGVRIKWPNDLIVEDRKLGGILTEAKTHANGSVTVVIGVGLNLDMRDGLYLGNEAKGSMPVTSVRDHVTEMPVTERLGSLLIDRLHAAVCSFEVSGVDGFAAEWARYDWLLGRELEVETFSEKLSGIGAGIGPDGALMVDVGSAGLRRITAGTIVAASKHGTRAPG